MNRALKNIILLCRCILAVPVAMVVASCSSGTNMTYVSDAEHDESMAILQNYTSTVHVGDRLYIYVSSQTPESVMPFNQETHKYVIEQSSLDFVDTTHRAEVGAYEMSTDTRRYTADITGYLVGQDGTVQFPILGKIQAAGMPLDTLASRIEGMLRDKEYVSDPTVEVKLMNFRVTVVGEVKAPKQINADGNRLTIFEALAMCGDITLYGRRDNVMIMREHGGVQEFGNIDLTSVSMFDSPYYYLQQNDVIYVEPTNLRKRLSSRNANVPAYIRMASLVAHIAVSTLSSVRVSAQMSN